MKRVDTSYSGRDKRQHSSSSQEESDLDIAAESQQDEAEVASFHSWLEKIQDPNPIEQSLDISVGYQSDYKKIILLHDAISNSKHKNLSFSGFNFDPEGAKSIFQACIANRNITEIKFPIWNIIFSPGQDPIMALEAELPLIADRYNQRRLLAFEYFKKLNRKGFKVSLIQEDQTITREYSFDEKLLDKHLAPFFKPTIVFFQ